MSIFLLVSTKPGGRFEVSVPFLSAFLQGLMSVTDDTLDGSRSMRLLHAMLEARWYSMA